MYSFGANTPHLYVQLDGLETARNYLRTATDARDLWSLSLTFVIVYQKLDHRVDLLTLEWKTGYSG